MCKSDNLLIYLFEIMKTTDYRVGGINYLNPTLRYRRKITTKVGHDVIGASPEAEGALKGRRRFYDEGGAS